MCMLFERGDRKVFPRFKKKLCYASLFSQDLNRFLFLAMQLKYYKNIFLFLFHFLHLYFNRLCAFLGFQGFRVCCTLLINIDL